MSVYAAVDIGSNSVRLAVGEGSFAGRLLDSDREVTRIGESVFATGRASQQAIEETCRVLERFAKALARWQPAAVRAVATSALRDARNQQEFLKRAGEALGTPIQIISGREEARLIHRGVLARWPKPEKRLLLLDIGGGSAEVTRSENGRIRYSTSVPLGAVRLTGNFLQHDPPEPEELARLEEYVDQQFAASLGRLGRDKRSRAIGTSATAGAVIAAVNRVKSEKADGRRAALPEIRRLYRRLARLDVAGRQRLPAIGPRRAEIIIAGAAVLLYFVEHFTGGVLYFSEAGLRDGIIADLAERGVTAEDAKLDPERLRAVTELARRFGVSVAHGRQVAALARSLFTGLAALHRLPASGAQWLEAAAYLHDVGHYVSASRHHRHSYYVVAHADLPGFTDRERQIVASLCRYHRKALPDEDHEAFRELDADDRRAVLRLIPLLRIADGLDRGHRQLVTSVGCRIEDGETRLEVAGRRGAELDLWGARQAADSFQQVYDSTLTVAPA